MNKMSKLLQAWDWLQKDDKSMGETVKKNKTKQNKPGKLQAWELILSVRWHNFYLSSYWKLLFTKILFSTSCNLSISQTCPGADHKVRKKLILIVPSQEF